MVFLSLGCLDSKAQLSIGPTDGLYVREGTTFFSDGLVMVPSDFFLIRGVEMSTRSGEVAWPEQKSIRRIYDFSRPVSFTGTIGFRYFDEELNGNMPVALRMAYSPVASGDYKNFAIGASGVTSGNWLNEVFQTPATFAEITAVSPGSEKPVTYTMLEASNMITPNGDGKNDVWVVKNLEDFPVNELSVYNREGKLVYSKVGYDNSWDGTYNGMALIEDTYYYVLTIDSGKKVLKGFVSLVRGD